MTLRITTGLLLGALPLLAQDEEKKGSFDEFLLDPEVWSMPLEDLKTQASGGVVVDKEDAVKRELREQLKKEGIILEEQSTGFEWLSGRKEALRAGPGTFNLFGSDVGEIVVRGSDGAVGTVAISIYNRGDDEEIKRDEFLERFRKWKSVLDEKIDERAHERDRAGAVDIKGWTWRKGDSAFLLESSWNKDENRAEFIRLRATSVSGARHGGGKITRRSTLDDNVKTDEHGFVWIDSVPMVDQGTKGYCVVATVERVARYYGIEIDQHEMAQLANTSGNGGTSGKEMEDAFKRVTGKIHARTLKLVDFDDRQFEKDLRDYNRAAKKAGAWTMDKDPDEWIINPVWFWSKADPEIFREVKADQNGFRFFKGKIEDYIDQGVPLCWTLFLGMFREGDLPQQWGGHMRMIIGYNYDDPEMPKIYYTDSWGEGHSCKTMRLDEAWCMTMGLYAMVPNR